VPQSNLGAQVVRLTASGVSAVATFTIVQPGLTATALAPLSENLVRVWSFDNFTKEWSYYDPRPSFASFNTVTQLVRGPVYWIRLNTAQTVTLSGSERIFYLGWNLLAW